MPHAGAWRVARQFGVPESMYRLATRRRLAGDWTGACAAAMVEAEISLADISRRHGRDVAADISEDLRHLVPELVRWHLPRRGRGGTGAFSPLPVVALATYGDPDADDVLALLVRTPAAQSHPQRVSLRLTTVHQDQLRTARFRPRERPRFERWDTARHLWHAEHTPRMREWLGITTRVPFHAPDGRLLDITRLPTVPPQHDETALVEWVTMLIDAGEPERAWRDAGFEIGRLAGKWPPHDCETPADPVLLLRTLTAAHLAPTVAVAHESETIVYVAERVTDSGRPVVRPRDHLDSRDITAVPAPWWRRNVDIDLLRAGVITPDGLHPLVRDALFTHLAGDDTFRPLTADPILDHHRVRCGGSWHQVGWRGGRLTALSHKPEEELRERSLRALGGSWGGCFATINAWGRNDEAMSSKAATGVTDCGGRVPATLRRQLRQLLRAAAFGDVGEVERQLESGIDVTGVMDRAGRTLLHLAAYVDVPDLVPRLVAAGMRVDQRDHAELTPLHHAVGHDTPPHVVRQLLDAGADPSLIVGRHIRPDGPYIALSALHLVRSRHAARVIGWLIDHGADLEHSLIDIKGTGLIRTPLTHAVINNYPAEVIVALLDAGADTTGLTPYWREEARAAADRLGRTELSRHLRGD